MNLPTLASKYMCPRSISPLSLSVWYCPLPTKPNGVGVVPVRLTVLPKASKRTVSVTAWLLLVMPRVLPSASPW
ncbi:MAG: hypothetical protein JWL77_6148 [Chthonomonadaceae bacterium]|nr:hypothetical protein [Chthonomonadaceae bacterium]